MLCIFKGPTKQIGTTPTGKRINLGAGDVQAAVQTALDVGGPVALSDPTIAYRPAGKVTLTHIVETAAARYSRRVANPVLEKVLPFNAANDPFSTEPLATTVVSETITAGDYYVDAAVRHNCVALAGRLVALADFPTGCSFGNGTTCNAEVVLTCGEHMVLSWMVLSPAAAATHKSNPAWQATLATLFKE